MSFILNLVLGGLFFGLIIWIVGKLGLGLTVSGFGPAFIAAIVIAAITAVINLIGGGAILGIIGAIVQLVISAIVLMLASRWVKGLQVNGFMGAIVASIAIGVVGWLIGWLGGLFI